MPCFCSISNTRMSNWLDRLRLSRGFPTTGGLNLDGYLSSLNNHQDDSKTENHQSVTRNNSPPPKLEAQTSDEGFAKMTNALSELFCMGDHVPVSVPRRKCPRKQANPKYCPPRNPECVADNTNCIGGELGKRKTNSPSPVNGGNNGAGLLKKVTNCDEVVNLMENTSFAGQEEDEVTSGLTLAGFSRTEVTVIDTSVTGWKFEKMLFRKDNSWKTLDKNSKRTSLLGKKKRKVSAMNEDIIGRARDEARCRVLHEGSVSKRTKGTSETSGSCNEEHVEAACTKTSGDIDKSPKKNLINGSKKN